MSDDSATLIPGPGESVATFQFRLAWADEATKQSLMAQMRANERQTMNLRLSGTARLLHLQRREDDATIGWGGVDAGHKNQAELFSFFVIPEYRSYTLGLILELARYTYLLSRGIKIAYLRMERTSNTALIQYRLSTGLFKLLEPSALDPAYVGLCEKCELYERQCTQQAFLEVDVEEFVEHGESRIGSIDMNALPREFWLKNEMASGSSQASARIGRYRPVWK